MSAQPSLPYQERLADFERLLETAQQMIVAQLEAFAQEGKTHLADARAQQLAAIKRLTAQIGDTLTPLASDLVREAYEQSAAHAAQQISSLSIDAPEIHGAFNGVSQQAVEALQRSLTLRFDDAMQTIGRRVEDVYAREQRRVALHSVLGAAPSPDAAAKELQARLLKEGATGFVDKAGRQWPLDTYAKMATRTITREAVVQGAMGRMVSHGIALARVTTHPNACEICQPFQGTLVDIANSGITEWQGEAVSDASTVAPYHPNCACSLMPVSALISEIEAFLAGKELEPA